MNPEMIFMSLPITMRKSGFVLAALRPKALEAARRLKPEIPLVGDYGILLRDEIEVEMWL